MDIPAYRERLVKPRVKFEFWHHKTISLFIPGFAEHQHWLNEACARNGIDSKNAAILLSEEEVGANKFHGKGPVLIANIPSYLDPYFAELVSAEPEIINIGSLDLRSRESLLVWNVTDSDGRIHSVAVPAGILPDLLTPTVNRDGKGMSFARFVFRCGEGAFLGAFWFDDDDVLGAQAASMCSQSYLDYSEEEQAAADARTIKAGSPTPWVGTPWTDDDGSIFTQLPVFSK
ncbi:hypothetical protein GTP46_26725 [Duganella sp. FT135W]|uniref:Uncharacterized protein n=1 Tax=Duganella flavida TaxID=2692175 RepID=A0A6L8KFK0_9BURK|nr:hypothetical protein [Duganella flavida]MYM26229.1 hypothetical protein [Duganella flavida]